MCRPWAELRHGTGHLEEHAGVPRGGFLVLKGRRIQEFPVLTC